MNGVLYEKMDVRWKYERYDTIWHLQYYWKEYQKIQKKLAESLLLSESFIAKLESVTYQTISIDTLDQIAHKLNTHISKFFLDDEEE